MTILTSFSIIKIIIKSPTALLQINLSVVTSKEGILPSIYATILADIPIAAIKNEGAVCRAVKRGTNTTNSSCSLCKYKRNEILAMMLY